MASARPLAAPSGFALRAQATRRLPARANDARPRIRRRDESPDGDLSLPRLHRALASPGGASAPPPTLRVSSSRRSRKRAYARHEKTRKIPFFDCNLSLRLISCPAKAGFRVSVRCRKPIGLRGGTTHGGGRRPTSRCVGTPRIRREASSGNVPSVRGRALAQNAIAGTYGTVYVESRRY